MHDLVNALSSDAAVTLSLGIGIPVAVVAVVFMFCTEVLFRRRGAPRDH